MKKVSVFLGQKNCIMEGSLTEDVKTILQVVETDENGKHKEVVRAVALNKNDFFAAVKAKRDQLVKYFIEKKSDITTGYRLSHTENIIVVAKFSSKKEEVEYHDDLWRVLREMPVTA